MSLVGDSHRPPAPFPSGFERPRAAEFTADHVEVRFQGLAAITDVSLTINRREILGLIGPNGAGKTTLINCMTGFQRPTNGRVLLARDDTTGWGPERFRRAGVGQLSKPAASSSI